MRYVMLAGLLAGFLGTAFGQLHGPYSSLGGYGNVLYPGTGHAPQTPPGGITGPNFRYGGAGLGRGAFANPLPATHPLHRRAVIVPYPVFYGGGYGYGYGYDPSVGYGPDYGDPPQAAPAINTGPTPAVVINQSFVPQQVNPQVRDYNGNDSTPDQQSSMRLYQNSSHPYANAPENTAGTRPAVADDQPTIYLIAFKDHSIVQALGYWMEGSTLHYVSAEHTLNQASLDLIDRDLSQRLNDERGIEFKLPAAR